MFSACKQTSFTSLWCISEESHHLVLVHFFHTSLIYARIHLLLSSFPFSPFLWQLLPSFRLSSLRCRITIMASCDDDAPSSSMEMQHATAHIIRAECIRSHLGAYTAVRSLCVKLFCGKQEQRESDGELYAMYSTVEVFLQLACKEEWGLTRHENREWKWPLVIVFLQT